MQGLARATAVVTGAAEGIGRATAIRLGEEGADVVVADIDERDGIETVDRIEDAGGEATFVTADVTDPDQVEAMVETATDRYGGLDVAVNNAGVITEMTTIDEIDPEQWARVMAINLEGVWNCLRFELPAMEATDGGAVVNVASVAGLVGMPTLGGYAASKHGVVGLTRTAALEYAPREVRVNAVAPGPTRTGISPQDGDDRGEWLLSVLPDHAAAGAGLSGRLLNWLSGGQIDRLARTPMERLAEPEEIASTIAFLASAEASFVTGQVLAADGGQTAD